MDRPQPTTPQKRDSFFQEVSFEYIIHNAQEKLFVARHQASEARSVRELEKKRDLSIEVSHITLYP